MNRLLNKLKVPVIQGGMGVGISMGGLAGAVAAEGGMGVISTADIGFREPDFWENPGEACRRALKAEIRKAKEISGDSGLLAINAMTVTSNFNDMVKTACEAGIDAVISGAGLPLSLPALVKGYPVMIAPVVSGGRAAKTLLRMWEKRHGRSADFIVCEGPLAGGHLGFSKEEAEAGERTVRSDAKSIAAERRKGGAAAEKAACESAEISGIKDLPFLVKEVCAEAGEIPVFAAGGAFSGREMKAVKAAGAHGLQIGTAFIAAKECDASEKFKEVILRAKKEDVRVFTSPVGMPGRGLLTPLIKRISAGEKLQTCRCIRCIRTCCPEKTPYCITRALIEAYYGNYEEGLFFCGSCVGEVNEKTTVHSLMEKIASEWRRA